MSNFDNTNVLFGHTDEATAIVVDDYPYGRQVRTQIRYWLETTKNGDRFCSQTLNPKTGKWNKPKKSTYCEVGVMFTERSTGYVRWAGLRIHDKPEYVEHFRAATEGNLSEAQLRKVAEVVGWAKAMENIKFEIKPGPMSESDRVAAAHNEDMANRHIAVNIFKATKEIVGG